MKTKILIFTLCLITMTACSSDNDLPETTGHQQLGNGGPITIEVSEAPLTDPNGAGTRAPITFKESLRKFEMHYLSISPKTYKNTTVTQTDADHTWSTGENWPVDAIGLDTPVYFFAYANDDYNDGDYSGFQYSATENYLPQNQMLGFEIDEYQSWQMDLLVATQVCTARENMEEHKPVHFHFKHACAALQFSLSKTEALANYGVDEIQVSKVVLHNVKKWGDYYFTDEYWDVIGPDDVDNKSPYADYTLAEFTPNSYIKVGTEPMLLTKDGDKDDYMFVIPQELTGWSDSDSIEDNDAEGGSHKSYIEIQCLIIGGPHAGNTTVYLPFSDTWRKGYIHRYNIRMGTNLRKANGDKYFSN